MSQGQRIVLGLDGGGTKTVCVAMSSSPSENGHIPLARVVVGSTNWNSVGVDQARSNLEKAIERALETAGRTDVDIDAICLGISGVDRPADHAQMQGWLAEILPGVAALIHNDAIIALASGTGGRLYGVVLISGTGMIAMGFNQAGERCRAGGWGALLGDGGSGYAIGAAVLRAVTWATDGRGPQTTLKDAVLERLQLTSVEQLVRWTYDDVSWNRIAELAPLAMREAAAGDAEALQVVRTAALDLALAVEVVALRLGIKGEPFPVVFAGGGLRSGLLSDKLQERFRKTLPDASVVIPDVEPAIGAALLAIQHSYQ